ncbi:MAG: FMN-binding protein [Terriglobia bacterium]
MTKRVSTKKVANSLVAVSSAAVLSVYAAGYARTRTAAQKFDEQTVQRRSVPAAAETRPMAALTVAPLPASAHPAETPVIARLDPPPALKRADSLPPRSETGASPQLPATVDVAPVPAAVVPAAPVPAPAAPVSPPPPPQAPAAPAAPIWKDGKYLGWGTSRHGDIQAAVVIEGGRIASATIAQCLTRYSCDVIDPLPPQVAKRQSPEIDYVSGATQSTNAFYFAVVDALSKAK